MDIYVKSSGDSDTKAINNAILECSKSGGGKVILTDSLYRAGRIIFQDNVELYLNLGCKLMASDDISEFDINGNKNEEKGLSVPTWENCDYSGAPTKFFLHAIDCKNISIGGLGVIDGNEEIYYGNVTKWHIDGYFYPRVPLIFFENCENVKINDITLQRSGFWTTHLVGCRNVIIDNVKILNSLRLANCDGIDPDHCQNVRISNCYIEAADDCIVFKTTSNARKYGECKDIEVYNCTLMSTSAAIKFGTESVSDFKNIYIHDCKIIKSNRGISFQLRDEGNISNIRFENIDIETRRFSPVHWWGKAEPISITAVKRKMDSKVGKIENIYFKNIKANSENGMFIFGDKNINISNVYFDNININLEGKTDWERNNHDLRPSEEYYLIENPINILYGRNAKDIYIKDLNYSISDNIKNDCGNIFDIDFKVVR
ncbi:MAG: right-handed parallel beta-helix repeat-containing protein [Acholeplasmatales bacterium]|nr:right-handed parallel beta-helix repeat-containing protein [Acholeplasmatales bacterium]